MTIRALIDKAIEENQVDPADLLHALVAGLARTHLLDADAYPDYAPPQSVLAETKGEWNVNAEILGLQHWISKPIWKYGQKFPPFSSLLEALQISILRESTLNNDHAADLDELEAPTLEQEEEAHDFGALADHQHAALGLLEEIMSSMDEIRLQHGKPIHSGSVDGNASDGQKHFFGA